MGTPSPSQKKNLCLWFLLERLYYPVEIGNNGYSVKIWEVNKSHYGLCETGELSLFHLSLIMWIRLWESSLTGMQPSNSKIKKTQYLHVILALKCSTQGVWRARLKKTVILYVGTKNLEFEEGKTKRGLTSKKRLYKAMPRELKQ